MCENDYLMIVNCYSCHFAAVDPSNGHNRGNHVAHSLVVGTFNMADQRDGAMPDIGRVSL